MSLAVLGGGGGGGVGSGEGEGLITERRGGDKGKKTA